MYDTFDNVRENIDKGWRSFKVDNYSLPESMNDDSLSAVKKLRQVKLWVVGYM